MDLQEALYILEIDNISNISLEYLKKKYHKLALKNHPDKHNDVKNINSINEYKEKFQKINEAYEILQKEINIINNEYEYEDLNTYTKSNINTTDYGVILNLFIFGIFKGKYNEFISNIIKDIVNGCKEISLKLFEDINKEQALMIYNFIIKYKIILNLQDETLDRVKDILLDKFKDIQIYVLNPSLNDLFKNNVYKLEINKKIYFVPLWHTELYFESGGNNLNQEDIIVKCNPELPDNIFIDEDNNLIVTENIYFNFSLLNEKIKVIRIGDLCFEIQIDKLYITPFQIYILKNQGISKIIENDIYDVQEKSDIIVKIIFIQPLENVELNQPLENVELNQPLEKDEPN